jgi:hypothetical protein
MGVCRAGRRVFGQSFGEVVEVAVVGWILLDFVEYREEVVEGVDGLQGWSVGSSEGSSGGGEQERGADELGGHALAVEVFGEASIGGGGSASGSGGLAVEGEDLADVLVSAWIGHVAARGAGLGLKSSK